MPGPSELGRAPDDRSLGRGFEWWMVANVGMGASFAAFIALLIPPYVNEVTGDIAASGAVMAVISLGALLGPVLGTFADRYRAHRAVLCGGLAGTAVGFAAFASASESASFYAVDAVVLGVSVAAVAAVGPVFVVGAGLSRELEARRMTALSLAMPVGQMIGALFITAAAEAGWSYADRFWMAAGFNVAVLALVLVTSAEPQRQLHAAMDAVTEQASIEDARVKIPLKTVLFSSFGAFLLVHTLSSMALNGINNQISNIMPSVYDISDSGTSTLIAVAGMVNIVLFFPAGRWMARSGAFTVYTAGNVMRFTGAFGMALVGWLAGSSLILAVAFMQILYQGNTPGRLAQPGAAVGFATFPAGAANGWLIGASATGSFLGSAVGGVVADNYGFNAVNWMGAACGGAAIAGTILLLLPAVRRGDWRRDAKPDPGATAKAAAP